MLVVIEQPHHDNITGEQLSRPHRQWFNPTAWKAFQEWGPRMGWWVREIVYAPSGLDASYANPDPNAAKVQKKEELLGELKALEQKIKALG